jgi:signal peptidase I
MRNPFDLRQDTIKRVVGLPGDQILVRDCMVSINGRRLVEPYIRGKEVWSSCEPGWPSGGRKQTLASDEFFVMGDNRDHSSDSRMFGPVERSQIQARVRMRVLPLNHLGMIDSQRPRLTRDALPVTP